MNRSIHQTHRELRQPPLRLHLAFRDFPSWLSVLRVTVADWQIAERLDPQLRLQLALHTAATPKPLSPPAEQDAH